MYAEHNDSSFSMAFAQRMIQNVANIQQALEVMSVMAEFAQQNICVDCSIQPPKLEYFNTLNHSLPTNFTEFLDLYSAYKYENS